MKIKKPTKEDLRREQATDTWREVAREAKEHGLLLRRVTVNHYKLSAKGKDWSLDLYPGDQTILSSAPFRTDVQSPWTLGDVVKAVAEKLER